MAQEPMVLVIDDSATSRHYIEIVLQREGYVTRTARDGHEGLDMVLRECPHCIILDVVLPGMSGYEVCRHLRSRSVFRGLPIIMISTKSTALDKSWAIRQGADHYLVKPFKDDDLLKLVKESIAAYNPPAVSATKQETVGPQRTASLSFSELQAATAMHRQASQQHTQVRPQKTPDPPPMQHTGLTGAISPVVRDKLIQQQNALPIHKLVPKRNQEQELVWGMGPHFTLATSKQVHTLYNAIDGQRDIEALCKATQMTQDEVVRALRSLLVQQRVHLCEPGGNPISDTAMRSND
jgi:DNA-binding response OmpR family regulator